MARNSQKGVLGDATNLFMAAAAFNFKKWMRKLGHFFTLFALWLFCNIKSRQPYMAPFTYMAPFNRR